MTADSRRLSVDLDRLTANVRRYRAAARGLVARVDHDGFGLGLLAVARACAAAGADMLAVADLDEAARLREHGVETPLLALRPVGAVRRGARVHAAAGSPHEAAAAVSRGAEAVHLVVDCGGAVRGVRPQDAGELAHAADGAPVAALMGVADASTPRTRASAALAAAAEIAGGIPRHLHGTAGVLAGHGADDDYVRVGRGLYGIPLPDRSPTGSPVARLTGRVVTVKRIRAGEGVSYGYIYRAPADGWIALVTGGYADGVPRSLGNRACAVVNGRRVRIIGRVAMDVLVVDLGDVTARPGDEAVLLGDPGNGEPSVSEWAAITGSDPVAVMAAIGPRVVRSYAR